MVQLLTLNQRAGTLIADWNEELESSYRGFEQAKPVATLASHPKRGADSMGPPSKRIKHDDVMADDEMRKAYQADKWTKVGFKL